MNGYGIGPCVILNSGCMSHGSIGGNNTGLSKALCMALVLLIRPLNENQPIDFSAAWYALNVSDLTVLHLDILRLLNSGVTKHFWVSQGLVDQGLGKGNII